MNNHNSGIMSVCLTLQRKLKKQKCHHVKLHWASHMLSAGFQPRNFGSMAQTPTSWAKQVTDSCGGLLSSHQWLIQLFAWQHWSAENQEFLGSVEHRRVILMFFSWLLGQHSMPKAKRGGKARIAVPVDAAAVSYMELRVYGTWEHAQCR